MKRLALVAALASAACSSSATSNPCTGWAQWSQGGSHSGDVCVAGQQPGHVLASIQVDPFANTETVFANGDILVHYQVPLTVDDDVYMLHKIGDYSPPCQPTEDGSDAACYSFNTQIWTEEHWHWKGNTLEFVWSAGSDWLPVPSDVSGSEELFQPVIVGDNLYLPSLGGTVWRVDRKSGIKQARIMPLGSVANDYYVTGPLVADPKGNVYYNVVHFDPVQPLANDVVAYLVKIAPNDTVTKVKYDDIVMGAPHGMSCHGTYGAMETPPDLP